MFYPFKFFPIYKEMLWGGRNIADKLGRKIPGGNIGESWEVCCRHDGMSIIANGRFELRSLGELISEYKEEILGNQIYDKSFYQPFPLLIKIIDANQRLSVQVHPDDEYASQHNDNGKTELWYVLDAKPGASLIYGFKDKITKGDIINLVNQGEIESVLNQITVNPGDVLYIPAGKVHAILEGVLIAEIQQNSNITYRLHDWARLDKDGKARELHIEDALNVIRFDDNISCNKISDSENHRTYSKKIIASNEHFTVEELEISERYSESTDGSRLYIYMIISGKGSIIYKDGELKLNCGDTILIPATMGDYSIIGEIKVLKIYV